MPAMATEQVRGAEDIRAGRERYVSRARETCGPHELSCKVRAVGEAYNHGDWKMLSGALADLAAISVAWEKQVRTERQQGYV